MFLAFPYWMAYDQLLYCFLSLDLPGLTELAMVAAFHHRSIAKTVVCPTPNFYALRPTFEELFSGIKVWH